LHRQELRISAARASAHRLRISVWVLSDSFWGVARL
jgi:hypothetical protein